MAKFNFKRFIAQMVAIVMIMLAVFNVQAAPSRVVKAITVNNKTVAVVNYNKQPYVETQAFAGALSQSGTNVTAEANQGMLSISVKDMKLVAAAGTNAAYLTTGIGTPSPVTKLVFLKNKPFSKADASGELKMYVEYSEIIRLLKGTLGKNSATLRSTASPAAAYDFSVNKRDLLPGTSNVRLLGRGATFPNTLYGKGNPSSTKGLFADYIKWSNDLDGNSGYSYKGMYWDSASSELKYENFDAANAKIFGKSDGSGLGLDAVRARLADFAGSDDPITSDYEKQHYAMIPAAMGGISIITNIEGVTSPLKLTADVVAEIYAGKIKKWNDPKLVRLNPVLKNIDKFITVVYRSNASGTSNCFTTWLKTSVNWTKQPSDKVFTTGSSGDVPQTESVIVDDGINFIGIASNSEIYKAIKEKNYKGKRYVNRSEEITENVNGTDVKNAIGYVVISDVTETPDTRIAYVRNSSGNWVKPTTSSIMAAGLTATDLTKHPVNSTNPGAYPIVALTWLVVEKDISVGKTDIETMQSNGTHTGLKDMYGRDISANIGSGSNNGIKRDAVTAEGQKNERSARMAVFKDLVDIMIVKGFGDQHAIDNKYAPLSPNMKAKIPSILSTIK